MSKQDSEQTAVLVLGIARSGSSALCGALGAMGVDFGPGLKPPDWQNPKGNYEQAELSSLNQEVLNYFGLNWSSARMLPEDWMARDEVQRLGLSISEILQRDFAETRLFGLKDPRLTQLLPLYLQVMSAEDVNVRLIVMKRSRDEVIQSIKRSGYLHGWNYPGRLGKLYDFYSSQLDQTAMDNHVVCVDYSALVYKPLVVLDELAAVLPFEDAGIQPDLDAAIASIDERLHRNRSGSC